MDARQYLEQVRDLHGTIVALQMRLHEQEQALDMLRTSMGDGMPHAQGDGKALENAIVEQSELMDEYTGELLRWTALRKQALAMLGEARAQLQDGNAHWIGPRHVYVVERHYVDRWTYRDIANVTHYSERTVKELAAQCIDWLDNATRDNGMPMVPMVSE
jgi:DNA-directed RNA polymerase specialized sigma24 family protein